MNVGHRLDGPPVYRFCVLTVDEPSEKAVSWHDVHAASPEEARVAFEAEFPHLFRCAKWESELYDYRVKALEP